MLFLFESELHKNINCKIDIGECVFFINQTKTLYKTFNRLPHKLG